MEEHNLLQFFSFPRKPPSRLQPPAPSCLPSSLPAFSATYNGWDDLRLRVDTKNAAIALIFAAGFSFEFVNGGSQGSLGSFGSKRKAKRDEVNIYGDKLKDLANLLIEFDGRIGKLMDDIRKAVDYQRVEIDNLEGYAEAVGVDWVRLVLNA